MPDLRRQRSATHRRRGSPGSATTAKIPGVAWGVIRDGALVHAGGAGTTPRRRGPPARRGHRVPDRVDDQVLHRRDDPRCSATRAACGSTTRSRPTCPQLAGWRHPRPTRPPITIRHLLTMSAGLPTDDPWGDRQQAPPARRLRASCSRRRPPFAWPPGTQFDYSNLGYGILGRVVTAAAGAEYRDVVRDRLLGAARDGRRRPTERGRDPGRAPRPRLRPARRRAGPRGHRPLRRAGVDGRRCTRPSATSPAGSRLPPRRVPRPRATRTAAPAPPRPRRREMQQVQRSLQAERRRVPAHEAPRRRRRSATGSGCSSRATRTLGTFVGHGGGYPGYGST